MLLSPFSKQNGVQAARPSFKDISDIFFPHLPAFFFVNWFESKERKKEKPQGQPVKSCLCLLSNAVGFELQLFSFILTYSLIFTYSATRISLLLLPLFVFVAKSCNFQTQSALQCGDFSIANELVMSRSAKADALL